LGEAETQQGSLIYVDTGQQVGNPIEGFRECRAAWFAENNPEGVALEQDVICPPA
jgi:hypothetical protein